MAAVILAPCARVGAEGWASAQRVHSRGISLATPYLSRAEQGASMATPGRMRLVVMIWIVLVGLLLSAGPLPGPDSAFRAETQRVPLAPSTEAPFSHGPALNSSPLPPNSTFAFAFDPVDGYAVYFASSRANGGSGSIGPNLGVTWVFGSGNWTQLNLTLRPPYTAYDPMTFDPARGMVILLTAGPEGTETWGFAAGLWSNLTVMLPAEPPESPGSSTAWDASAGILVLFRSAASNQTWALNNSTWSEISTTLAPSQREWPSLASDPQDQGILLFGGAVPASGSSVNWSNQTWIFAHGAWAEVATPPAATPPGRIAAAITEDTALSSVVLFGGITNTPACAAVGGIGDPTTYLNDTWQFVGGAWIRTALGSSADRAWAQMVYDPLLSAPLLFGGARPANGSCASDESHLQEYDFDGSVEVLGSNGSHWAVAAPRLNVSLPSVDVGVNVTISPTGYLSASAPSVTYFGLPPGCTAGSTTEAQCRPTIAGAYNFSATVYSSGGAISQASGTILVNKSPEITLMANRSTVRLGEGVLLSAAVSGGTPSFAFDFFGLPPGCLPTNSSSLSCTPSSQGNFSITIEVADRFGQHATASVVLVVTPPVIPPNQHTGGGNGWFGTTYLTPMSILLYAAAGSCLVGLLVGVRVRHRRRLRTECEELVREIEARIE